MNFPREINLQINFEMNLTVRFFREEFIWGMSSFEGSFGTEKPDSGHNSLGLLKKAFIN